MKTSVTYLVIAALVLFINPLSAQTINWASLKKENKHIIHTNVGVAYGMNYGIGYGYQVKNKWFPAMVDVEYSFPSGDKIFDDFKVKIGGQIRWIEYRNFRFSTGIHGVFRRYGNDFVRLVNFGSDISGVVGYYRTKWFVAGEVGFDKAIVTNFKHTKAYKDQFPGVADGWYEPATGGNFNYGLQAGYSFSKCDVNIKAGKLLTQDFKTQPTIPFYVQLGGNFRF